MNDKMTIHYMFAPHIGALNGRDPHIAPAIWREA